MNRDIRFAIRILGRQRAVTLIAIITLAIGIGAVTSVFSVVNSVLVKPLKYRDSDNLVLIWGNFLALGLERLPAQPAEYLDYSRQKHLFDQVGAFRTRAFNLSAIDADPERVSGALVTSGIFEMLGAEPFAGALFNSENDRAGKDDVVVLSYDFWQNRFAGDRSLIGGDIHLDGLKYKVVGVLPADFMFPHRAIGEPAKIYVPLSFPLAETVQRGGRYENKVLARLRPGVSIDQANAGMEVFARSVERFYRGPNNVSAGWRITVEPLQQFVVGANRRLLPALLAIAGLVLLIACSNIANLLLGSAANRQKEIATRQALGASGWRIARQLLIESLLLSVAGGMIGLLLTALTIRVLARLNPADLPRIEEIGFDSNVLFFSVIVTVATVILSGIAPILQVFRRNPLPALLENRSVTTNGWRLFQFRHLLLVAQISLTLAVLVCAGLLVNSFIRLLRVDPGLDTSKVLTVEITLPQEVYPDSQKAASFFSLLLERVTALPGVTSAGAGSVVPLSGAAIDDPFSIDGRPLNPDRMTVAGHQSITPGFFQALGIELSDGRDFNGSDTADSPAVAIINETMARCYWPGASPIGSRIKIGAPGGPARWSTIVGIVRDIPHRGLDSKPMPDWYQPHTQAASRTMTLFVKNSIDQIAPAIRHQIRSIDPAQPVSRVMKFDDLIAASLDTRRFVMFLLGIFASAALFLAATGVYGSMAYAAKRRSREIGIRVALGAGSNDVTRMMVREGMILTLIGISLGAVLAVPTGQAISGMLFDIGPTNPATMFLTASLLLAVTAVASYVPARRAAAADPMTILRHE